MAVRFDADGEDYTSASSPPSGDFTIISWIKLSVDRNTFTTFWSADAGTGDYIYLQTNADGTTVKAEDNAGNMTGTLAMTVGTWYRTAFVRNGTTSTFYHATAAAVALTAAATNNLEAVTATTLRIGESPFGAEWLNGCVANLKHYSGVLTPTEIERELVQYVPERTANLVRWHPFLTNETTDYSGNARTLSGGAGTAREDGPPIPWISNFTPLIISTSAGGNLSNTITDNVGLLDTAADVVAAVRSQTDNVGILDAAARTAALTRSQTDPVGLLDAASRVVTTSRAQTDTIGLLDSVADVWTLSRTQTDPIGITDSVARVATIITTVGDVVGITDAVTDALARLLTDNIGITDSVTDAWTLTRVQSDGIGLLDIATDTWALTRVATDPIGITDAVSDVWTIARTITESIGITDTASGQVDDTDVSRTLTDQITITDPLAVVRTSTHVRTDPIGITDSRALSRGKTVTDVIGVVDSLAKSLAKTITDGVSITDVATPTRGNAVVLTDVVVITDSTITSDTKIVLIVDLITISDDATGSISGPQTGLRVRVSGTESINFGAGNEPTRVAQGVESRHQVDGREVGTR